MRILVKINCFIAFVVLVFTGAAHAESLLLNDHPLVGKIWDMKSRSFIDESTLLARANKADVLLLGETHDNPLHHELQQKLLKARIASGARPALMMEQLDIDTQSSIDHALNGSNRAEVLDNLTKLIKFADRQFYRPFLAIAIDNKLPVIAANIPSQRLQPVIWHGFAAFDAAELKSLDVEQVWSESRQKYLVSHMGGAHCGQLRDGLRAGLSRSQRLRDALMVDSAVSSIDRGVVGIVGSSHARRDVGLPIYFAARAPTAHVYSIAFVEVVRGRTNPNTYKTESATGNVPFDAVWFTPSVARSDPCAKLDRQRAQPSVSNPSGKS
jgi:uncharacterized iron-regulated protein